MNDEHDEHHDPVDEQVGSLAEEGAKLFAALGDWARDQGADLGVAMATAAGQAAGAAQQIDEHLATGAAECTFCPICRTVHVVRQTSPEVRAQLTIAGNALLQAGAGLLASLAASQAGASRPGSGETGPSVQRIDLDDDESPESSSEKHDGWEA